MGDLDELTFKDTILFISPKMIDKLFKMGSSNNIVQSSAPIRKNELT